jgi:hypothetical protein
MKAYLITTGSIFGLLALLHLVLTIIHWPITDSESFLRGPGIGILAGALCFWAWRLLRHSARP